MSDSSIALKPEIDEPSKPMPSSSASSISLGVIAKLFRCPSMSVNQRSANSTPSSRIRSSTACRAAGSDVARFLVSTCAMQNLLLKCESLERAPAPEAASPHGASESTAAWSAGSSSSGSRPWCATARP
jgi:hypothetical protein